MYEHRLPDLSRCHVDYVKLRELGAAGSTIPDKRID